MAYTASKLYPYILANNQLLAIFHSASSAARILISCNAGTLIPIDETKDDPYLTFREYLKDVLEKRPVLTNWKTFQPYTAMFLTQKQVQLFKQVLSTKLK